MLPNNRMERRDWLRRKQNYFVLRFGSFEYLLGGPVDEGLFLPDVSVYHCCHGDKFGHRCLMMEVY